MQKKNKFKEFLSSSYGADILSKHLIFLGVVLYIVSSIFGLILVQILSFALYALVIFRIFSKNISARSQENQKYSHILNRYRQNVQNFVATIKKFFKGQHK